MALLEAAVKQYEGSLDIRHRGILTISDRAEQMFEVLQGDSRSKVSGSVNLAKPQVALKGHAGLLCLYYTDSLETLKLQQQRS